MQFSAQVVVFASDNIERFVTRVTSHHAAELLRDGSARAIGSGRTIRAVQLQPGAPLRRVGHSRPFYVEELGDGRLLPMLKRAVGGPRDGYVRW